MRFRWPSKPPKLPLDEPTLRRPDFTEGPHNTAIRLANGQSWWFPKPVIELRIAFEPGGNAIGWGPANFGDGKTRAFGSGYLELLDEADNCKYDTDKLGYVARIAAYLLCQNYNVTQAHLQALLPLVFNNDDNLEMWTELTGVVGGVGKEHGRDGNDSPTS